MSTGKESYALDCCPNYLYALEGSKVLTHTIDHQFTKTDSDHKSAIKQRYRNQGTTQIGTHRSTTSIEYFSSACLTRM